MEAQNLWRHWMIAHNLPRTLRPTPACTSVPATPPLVFDEMVTSPMRASQYFVDRYVEERVPIDYWWMDAGWYPCDDWPKRALGNSI